MSWGIMAMTYVQKQTEYEGIHFANWRRGEANTLQNAFETNVETQTMRKAVILWVIP